MSDIGKKRILFVDDDPAVLNSLQNVLRRDRHRWDMVFAVGGVAALDELRKTVFDAVVSDMRMPGVDGAQLLEAVARESQATVRIMLSGSDCEEALHHVDELLSKPCSARHLRETLERMMKP
jgi:DNA-binding NtrC family response regulator